jgi:hypothetical protein
MLMAFQKQFQVLQMDRVMQNFPAFLQPGLSFILFLKLCRGSRIFLDLQELPGRNFVKLEFPGVSWSFLEFLRVSWTLLEFPGLFWSFLDFPGLSWTFLDFSWTFLDLPGIY